jgi:hypothetical protein
MFCTQLRAGYVDGVKPVDMKIVSIIIFVTAVFFATSVSAQSPYKTALGVRVGGTSGVTLKHFSGRSMAVEGMLGTFGNGFSVGALAERHANAFDAVGLNWYYGAGGHVAFYNGNTYYRVNGREVPDRENHDVAVGIDGIVGLEYTLPDDIPVTFSFDFKPFIEVDNDGDFGVAPDLAISIRFILR